MRRSAPINWAKITTQICDDRAEGRCECAGECGAHMITPPCACGRRNHSRCNTRPVKSRCTARHGRPDEVGDWTKLVPVPLDRIEFRVEPKNLLAMCGPCRKRFAAEGKTPKEEPEGLFEAQVQAGNGLLL